MQRLVFLVAFFVAATAAAAADLATVAEKSEWRRTGRYDEVVRLCGAFARAYPGRVRCEKFGVTPEGRPMLALVAGPHGRPTVVVQGGIHAGEIDGKDAGFAVLRQLLDGKSPILQAVTLVFVPVFNVDGHERFGRNNRPNQSGPEEMGWRVTAQNLNLNRDYLKADAPEMAAMLRLLERWDPILYVDLHVTDGAEFQHDVSVQIYPAASPPGAPRALAAAGEALRQATVAYLTKKGHLPLSEFYPLFVRDDDPASGFPLMQPPPRFSTGYWPLRNRLAILVETHSWKDYATRVRATRDTLEVVLAELAAHGAEWQQAARAGDEEAAALGGKEVTLDWETDKKQSRTIEFLGYAYTRTPSTVSGKMRVIYDRTRPEVWKVPFYDHLLPSVTTTAPRGGYLVPAAWAPRVAEKLRLHGVKFSTLTAPPGELPLEAFRATRWKTKPSFEGRAPLEVEGAWRPAEARDRVPIGPGSLFVPMAQPRARVVLQLLEPQAPDSLCGWGTFNAAFEQKEAMEDYVAEAFAVEQLKDPAVKADFERRLADPEFKRSPRERLDYFYRRHPSWDNRMGLYPVYRTDGVR